MVLLEEKDEVSVMDWSQKYTRGVQPSMDDVDALIGTLLWKEFRKFMEVSGRMFPKLEYSGCTMKPGWNIKYRRGGKNTCTVYPEEGYFTCLTVIGEKEAEEARLLVSSFSPYMQELYRSTQVFRGSRWLMVEVRQKEILSDLIELVCLRGGI